MGNIIKTIILGIIEGVTEWLPVSSTGHLILFNSFMPLDMSDAFVSMFDVVIQFGAILAVMVIYFRKLWPFHTPATAPARSQFKNMETEGAAGRFQHFANNWMHMDRIVLWLKIIVAVIPAVIVGFPLDDWLDAHLYNAIVVAIMLIVYGVFFYCDREPQCGEDAPCEIHTRDFVEGCADRRSVPVSRHDPRNLPFRRDDHRRYSDRTLAAGCCGIYFLPGYSDHARGICAEDRQIQRRFHRE
jgi:undecaprenyl pyrophosphate phosphatase UppP